jgi:hypothetical protein
VLNAVPFFTLRGRETSVWQSAISDLEPSFSSNFYKGEFMITVKYKKRYGFMKFVGDVLMTCLTGGFWLIWIFVREMRSR